MAKAIHFISGLPRSGSTVLASILAQSPEVHAGITSPLLELVSQNIRAMSQCAEFASLISDIQRKIIIKGVFASYYDHVTKSVVFDTNRWWTSKMDIIADMLPDASVIACVRNVRDIVNSFELLYRKNKYQASAIYGFNTDTNVYIRSEMLLGGRGAISAPLQCLREAYYGPHASRLLLVKYESIRDKPLEVLKAISGVTGIKRFKPNLRELKSFKTADVDSRIGTPGLHEIRRQLGKGKSAFVLPPDIVRRCDVLDFWCDKGQARRTVKCI